MKVTQRFLKYVSFDTTSSETSDTVPTTDHQKVLGRYLAQELAELGLEGAHMDDNGYVYALLPATPGCQAPALGLIAHMDPAPDASGENVNIMVFDTEVYSNTGGQASKASQIGQVAQFAAAGKSIAKKSLAEIAMSYGYVYVAQIAMGANMNQTIKAIEEAEAYPGPSIVIAYAPCEMHSIKGGMVNCQKEMKRAVECGYWNMFRFNPMLKAEGKNPFTIDSKQPVTEEYRNFLLNEARYSSLTRSFPERAEKLFSEAEVKSVERYEHLLRLKDLYAPKAD